MTASDRLPELLAPCGSPEALEAALAGGADAVYLGGTMLNARMNAKNFDRTALTEAVASCHAAGVKLYVTLNTLVFDREMKEALAYAAFLSDIGVDALIVTDIGLITLLRRCLPQMPLHASTQMTAHCADAVFALRDMGLSRVVCAREMKKEDIRKMVETDVEIEQFVHGALCVSCSGQCLMSAMLGGRSGNRGECAQPCRMSYNGSFPLSLKDLCLAGHIPELIESGVASLKIEGRMKSPAYVYGVTSIYRRLLDERRAATEEEIGQLARLFSRGGFTDGYYEGKIDAAMLGVRSEKDISESQHTASSRIPSVKPRLPAITIEREEAVIPPDAFAMKHGKALSGKPIRTARFQNAMQIPETNAFAHIFLPLAAFTGKRIPGAPAPDGVILPPVIFDSQREQVERQLKEAVQAGATHVMVGNLGHIALAKQFPLTICGDYRLNLLNNASAAFYADTQPESLLLSPELNLPQIRDIILPSSGGPIRKAVIVYGRLPLMLLQRPTGLKELRDTRSARFPIVKEGERESVLNSVPLYMADQTDRLCDAGIREQHFLFTTEDRSEVLRVIYAYDHGVIPKDPIRRLK